MMNRDPRDLLIGQMVKQALAMDPRLFEMMSAQRRNTNPVRDFLRKAFNTYDTALSTSLGIGNYLQGGYQFSPMGETLRPGPEAAGLYAGLASKLGPWAQFIPNPQMLRQIVMR